MVWGQSIKPEKAWGQYRGLSDNNVSLFADIPANPATETKHEVGSSYRAPQTRSVTLFFHQFSAARGLPHTAPPARDREGDTSHLNHGICKVSNSSTTTDRSPVESPRACWFKVPHSSPRIWVVRPHWADPRELLTQKMVTISSGWWSQKRLTLSPQGKESKGLWVLMKPNTAQQRVGLPLFLRRGAQHNRSQALLNFVQSFYSSKVIIESNFNLLIIRWWEQSHLRLLF